MYNEVAFSSEYCSLGFTGWVQAEGVFSNFEWFPREGMIVDGTN